jgi:hypothetical protein
VGEDIFNAQVMCVIYYMKTPGVQHCRYFYVVSSGTSGFSGYVQMIPASTTVIHLVVNNAKRDLV